MTDEKVDQVAKLVYEAIRQHQNGVMPDLPPWDDVKDDDDDIAVESARETARLTINALPGEALQRAEKAEAALAKLDAATYNRHRLGRLHPWDVEVVAAACERHKARCCLRGETEAMTAHDDAKLLVAVPQPHQSGRWIIVSARSVDGTSYPSQEAALRAVGLEPAPPAPARDRGNVPS